MENDEQQPALIEAYDHEIEKPSTSQKNSSRERNPDQNRTLNSSVARNENSRRPRMRDSDKPAKTKTSKPNETLVDHTYLDFANVPPEKDQYYFYDTLFGASSAAAAEGSVNQPNGVFCSKLHEILSNDNFTNYISWMPHGRAFRIIVPKRLEIKVFPLYFGIIRVRSFLRQLTNWGFKQLTQGVDRNCYYHQAFLRGLPHLCKYMTKSKVYTKLNPDPENEPDFYRITEMYPLPEYPDFQTASRTSISESAHHESQRLSRLASNTEITNSKAHVKSELKLQQSDNVHPPPIMPNTQVNQMIAAIDANLEHLSQQHNTLQQEHLIARYQQEQLFAHMGQKFHVDCQFFASQQPHAHIEQQNSYQQFNSRHRAHSSSANDYHPNLGHPLYAANTPPERFGPPSESNQDSSFN